MQSDPVVCRPILTSDRVLLPICPVEYFQRVVRTGITVTGRDVKAGPNLASVDRPGRDALFADAKRSSVHAGTGFPPGAAPSTNPVPANIIIPRTRQINSHVRT